MLVSKRWAEQLMRISAPQRDRAQQIVAPQPGTWKDSLRRAPKAAEYLRVAKVLAPKIMRTDRPRVASGRESVRTRCLDA